MKNLLITGTAALAGRYPLLRLADIRPCRNVGAGEEEAVTDVTDFHGGDPCAQEFSGDPSRID